MMSFISLKVSRTGDCSLSVRLNPALYASVRRNDAQAAHVQTELSSLCELSDHCAGSQEGIAGNRSGEVGNALGEIEHSVLDKSEDHSLGDSGTFSRRRN